MEADLVVALGSTSVGLPCGFVPLLAARRGIPTSSSIEARRSDDGEPCVLASARGRSEAPIFPDGGGGGACRQLEAVIERSRRS